MFDQFSICSGSLFYCKEKLDHDDWLIEIRDKAKQFDGTFVSMEIGRTQNGPRAKFLTNTKETTLDFEKLMSQLRLEGIPGSNWFLVRRQNEY